MSARSIALKGTIGAIAVVVGLVISATAASAVPSPYNVELIRGRISVGSTNFDTPTTPPPDCPGTTGISGTINDSTPGTITGTLNIQSGNFPLPLFGGRYRLTATGTSGTGTYTGGPTGTFSGLTFSSISFQIRTVGAAPGCAAGALVCSGTANLTASGGVVAPSTVPLSTGEQVFVNGNGQILTTSGCGFPWSAVVTPGAALAIGQNPAFPADAGAIFQQL